MTEKANFDLIDLGLKHIVSRSHEIGFHWKNAGIKDSWKQYKYNKIDESWSFNAQILKQAAFLILRKVC